MMLFQKLKIRLNYVGKENGNILLWQPSPHGYSNEVQGSNSHFEVAVLTVPRVLNVQ